MLFPTVTFAAFFVGVFAAVWLARPHPRVMKLVLLGASWIFYAWWDWRFVVLLAGSILLNHLLAKRVVAGGRAWLPAGIALNLAILGFFKYFGFFATSLLAALGRFGITPDISLIQIVLPIGISFYTFEAMAYLIELRRGITTRLPLLDLATYLSFFPKLTSGPITRASEFGPQLDPLPRPYRVAAPLAFWLIGRGLLKKMVVVSFLGDAIVTGVFATPSQYSGFEVLIGIYAYTAELYLDFSGYTDMALGLALLLGFRLPENFDRPYTAPTVTAFWGRWHMSLTRWLRDFLFEPLARRSSRTPAATARILILVMLLMGLWHGAGWTFIVWGAIHGVAMALERLHRLSRRRRRLPPLPTTRAGRFLRWALTFNFVSFAWVFFRADSIGTAIEVFGRLAVPGPTPAVTPLLLATLVAVFAFQFVSVEWLTRIRTALMRARPVVQGAVLGMLLLVIDALGPEGVPSFIYFRF